MKTGFGQFRFPPGNLTWYRKIAALLRERKIPCVVVIPPLHAEVAFHMRNGPAYVGYQAWRQELDSVFTTVVDLAFGPYGVAESFFKADPLHFKPEAGERFMNEEVIPAFLSASGSAANAGSQAFVTRDMFL